MAYGSRVSGINCAFDKHPCSYEGTRLRNSAGLSVVAALGGETQTQLLLERKDCRAETIRHLRRAVDVRRLTIDQLKYSDYLEDAQ